MLKTDKQATVLDLACGLGRNGLHLIENDISVVFADINGESLEQIKQSTTDLPMNKEKLAKYWQVDFEQKNTKQLKKHTFDAVMVFRYLHRPLFDQIKKSIKPNGIIIYETFTTQQADFGRPKNPDFLLQTGELVEIFSDWKVLHQFEGVINGFDDNGLKQAIAQIVAVKPVA
jgi:SAM-dependent methyltransferase